MAKVLEHLTKQYDRAEPDRWFYPYAKLDTVYDSGAGTGYLNRYSLILRIGSSYSVDSSDIRAIQYGKREARRSLVRHLYGEQLDMAHKMMHAIYGGESRNEIADRLTKLIDSMTETGDTHHD